MGHSHDNDCIVLIVRTSEGEKWWWHDIHGLININKYSRLCGQNSVLIFFGGFDFFNLFLYNCINFFG